MFDEPQHDPRDYPTAEAIEAGRRLVFPEPLEGVTPRKERDLVGAVLTMRNWGLRKGLPLATGWLILSVVLLKIMEVIPQALRTDEERAAWIVIFARLRQLFTGEPTEEVVDRIYREAIVTADPGDAPQWGKRHLIVHLMTH